MNESYKFTPDAGYRQFYLTDAKAEGNTGADNFWNEEAFNTRIPLNPGILGVSTDTNGRVPVEVVISEDKPDLELDHWDHVVEANIDLSSGQLGVVGCPDEPEGGIKVTPGIYRARVHFGALGTADNEAEEGDDHYLIILWRAPHAERTVLKKWNPDQKKA